MSTKGEAGSFGRLLRQARTAAALSQEELAERAGLSARGISDLERGLHRAPRLETVRMLAGALGLDDASRAALLAAARPEPAGTVARTHTSSLPVPPTRLVGREREVATLTVLLRQDAVRLLTLTGPGGSGKTRLAIAVAGNVSDAYPDGTVFVDLAPLADPALILATIAQAVGLRAPGAADLTEAMRAFLIGKKVLLVLDNFEHLLDGAPAIAELLSALPALTVLTTSREPLRLRGEREFQVLPLAVPDARQVEEAASIARSDAVTLFVERARDARADFTLTASNAPVVAAICRRLDGLPLALELAAARMRGLPLPALRERLEQALPMLTGGARDAPARQRSLRDTIAWSHDLLSPAEQTLFRRLGVFAGGWTLDAAEAIASIDGDLDVLAGLSSLADKSLVRLDESLMSSRYRMLETVREYALDRLLQNEEELAAIRRAHAMFFANLAIAAESGLCSGVLAEISRVESDLDNLRATLSWLLDSGDADTALRVAGSLSEYWTFAGGQFTEGFAWLERALSPGAAASPSSRAAGHYGIAMLALHQADLETARAAAAAGLALARSANDARRVSGNAFMLSSVEGAEGHHREAMSLALEAETVARAAGDVVWTGWALQILGAEWHASGDLAGATIAFEEARDIFREIEGRWGEADTTERLAHTVRAQGDLRRAAALHARALMLRREIGAAVGIEDELIGIADLAREAGNLQAAAVLLGTADAYEDRYGYAPFRETPPIRERAETALREQLGAEAFARAREEGRSLSHDDAIAEALAIADKLSGSHPGEGSGER